MQAVRKPRVKICCIKSPEEAKLAIQHGAAALGFVSHMPSGPGVIDERQIAQIATTVPPPICTFLLTCKQEVAEIIVQHRRCRTNCIQICDRLTFGTHQELREALPGISIVQVIHVTGPESIAEAVTASLHVNAILLDSGNQSLAVKQLGGTGRIHDWTLSRRIREAITVPMFLAGGLSPQNVQRAIEEVGPFGVDLCSSVRMNGNLDAARLNDFFAAVDSVA